MVELCLFGGRVRLVDRTVKYNNRMVTMKLGESLGITCIKICPDCGDMGARLTNRCPDCEKIHGERQKKEVEIKAEQDKKAKRRANGFDDFWGVTV